MANVKFDERLLATVVSNRGGDGKQVTALAEFQVGNGQFDMVVIDKGGELEIFPVHPDFVHLAGTVSLTVWKENVLPFIKGWEEIRQANLPGRRVVMRMTQVDDRGELAAFELLKIFEESKHAEAVSFRDESPEEIRKIYYEKSIG